MEQNWENQGPISQTKNCPLAQQLQMPWVLGGRWAPGGKGEAEGQSPHYNPAAAVTKHHKMSALEQQKPTVSVLEIRHLTHLVLAELAPSEAERKVWPRPPPWLAEGCPHPHASSHLPSVLKASPSCEDSHSGLGPPCLLLHHLIFTNLNYYLISK